MIVLGVLAVIGALTVAAVIAFLLDTPPEGQTRWMPPERPQSRQIQPSEIVYVPPTRDEEDAQAIRDHRRLVVEYRAMIDELYDAGEDAVRGTGDQP